MKTLQHKGKTGTIEYCDVDEVYYGKVLNTKHLITYEGVTLEELAEFFEFAVDDAIKDGALTDEGSIL